VEYRESAKCWKPSVKHGRRSVGGLPNPNIMIDPRLLEVAERWAKRYPYSVDQIVKWKLRYGKWRFVIETIELALAYGTSPDQPYHVHE